MPSALHQPVWDDAPAAVRPPLTGAVDADVCVVGLGGSGLSCVRAAQQLGATVVGIDAAQVGAGAAGRNGGFLLAGLADFHHDAVARHGRARARAIYRLTLDELDVMAAETPSVVTRGGSLRIAESDDELADCMAQLAAMTEDGLPAERYDGREGRGLLIPGDGVFQPLSRCRLLAAAAEADGARLFGRTAVTSVEGGRVRTERGEVRCRHVVVAVDGGLERILPELTGRVRSARLQMLATDPTEEVRLTRPVYARWGYDYWQQREDGTIALGGGRDVGGDAEWTTVASPTEVVQGALDRRLRDTLGVRARVSHRWAAIVGYTVDGLPVTGEVRPGVWAIGGYCGTGNVIGSLLGRGVARALFGGDAGIVELFRGRDAGQAGGELVHRS